MEAVEAKKGRARLGRTTVAAAVIAVFAVLLMALSGAYVGGAALARGSAPGEAASTGFVPFALANIAIDLNLSEQGGAPYQAEYVTVNNSSTLTKLPAALTVVASTCLWITVENLTEPLKAASVFHNLQFHNRTSANDTGSVAGGGASAFKICGGGSTWLNYQEWTYSIYDFSAPNLGTPGIASATFGDWPGMTTGPLPVPGAVPAGFTDIGGAKVFQLVVPSNLTFTVTLPFQTNSSTSCSELGQVCSFTRYTFSAATDTANTTASSAIAFTVASKLLVTAAYENWTVSYTSASISANTGIGGFFAGSSSLFQTVVVQFWYLWILGFLVIALVAAIASKRRR